jgi:hypothetical protein
LLLTILYLTTCVILQDDSESAEDQPRAVEHPSGSREDLFGRKSDPQPHVAEHPSGSGEDLSGHESESVEDPLGSPEDPSTQVPSKRRTRKSHYAAPPPVPTNPESRPIIRPIADR